MPVEQAQRTRDLASWFEARQASLKIVKTTTTPSGQTIDWVPLESQHPSGKIATPPPADLARVPSADAFARSAAPSRIARPSTFELDDPKVERGPDGTVPILRPDIARLSRFAMSRIFTSSAVA